MIDDRDGIYRDPWALGQHRKAVPIDHPSGSVLNEHIADGTIDLTRKCTYVPVNRAGDTMTGTLIGQLGAGARALRVGVPGTVGSVYDSPLIRFDTDYEGYGAELGIKYAAFRVSGYLVDILSGGVPIRLYSSGGSYGIEIWAWGNVLPSHDNFIDLGAGPWRFRDLYLSGHVRLPASTNILARVFNGAPKTVTETTYTLKDEVYPVSPKTVLYPKHAVVSYANPAGSGVTLGYELRLVHSDGDETVAFSRTGIAEGSSGTDDILGEVLADAMKDGCSVTGIRLYASVSAAPPAGYEPTVTLTKVRGVQF